MIISKQKPLEEILAALEGCTKVFLVGCAKCATVCKSGGEEEVFQMQERLSSSGFEVTGSIVIDEACHMLRAGRDLRGRKEAVEETDALLVMACGAGVQSVAGAAPKKSVAALDTLFLGNIRRFGQFEQKCSLCGECIVSETAGICPVTVCAKGLLNGPCGGMTDGRCETDPDLECAWVLIHERIAAKGVTSRLRKIVPAKDFSRMLKPGKLKVDK
ncbi:MAG TPA: methylenetetrahydrofolate reductase C-terminal domain-containing protein [Geobacteraceae bacterium]|nr:methylenetetrahydrofolate reductase C-terminal domain-containing protein [Geobacteraceae bacterium]